MSTTHGVTTTEVATSVFAVRESPSAIPFIVGTAPKDGPNAMERVEGFKDFAETFGQRQEQDGTWDFTLARFAELHFQQYGSAPAIIVNVLEPESDTATATGEQQTFDRAEIRTDNAHIDVSEVTDDGGGTTYDEGTDYEVAEEAGVITRLESGSISQGETVEVTYDYVDPSLADSSDIVGGVDSNGNRSGLELVEEAYQTLGTAPTLLLAPGFSSNSTVASAIEGKAGGFGCGWKAFGLVDIDSTAQDSVQDAVNEKPKLTTGSRMAVCWPRVTLGEDTDWLSAHMAGVIARTDRQRGAGLPYFSPSNKDLAIDGTDVEFSFSEANTLNKNGITTVIRREGFSLWGDRTAAFPGETDVKDSFIATRRMGDFLQNTLQLTIFDKVDEPTNRRLIDSVVSSLNQTFSGFEAQGALLSANVVFDPQDNPTADLLDGELTFRLFYTPPVPAEEIEFILEVDPDGFNTLFG